MVLFGALYQSRAVLQSGQAWHKHFPPANATKSFGAGCNKNARKKPGPFWKAITLTHPILQPSCVLGANGKVAYRCLLQLRRAASPSGLLCSLAHWQLLAYKAYKRCAPCRQAYRELHRSTADSQFTQSV